MAGKLEVGRRRSVVQRPANRAAPQIRTLSRTHPLGAKAALTHRTPFAAPETGAPPLTGQPEKQNRPGQDRRIEQGQKSKTRANHGFAPVFPQTTRSMPWYPASDGPKRESCTARIAAVSNAGSPQLRTSQT